MATSTSLKNSCFSGSSLLGEVEKNYTFSEFVGTVPDDTHVAQLCEREVRPRRCRSAPPHGGAPPVLHEVEACSRILDSGGQEAVALPSLLEFRTENFLATQNFSKDELCDPLNMGSDISVALQMVEAALQTCDSERTAFKKKFFNYIGQHRSQCLDAPVYSRNLWKKQCGSCDYANYSSEPLQGMGVIDSPPFEACTSRGQLCPYICRHCATSGTTYEDRCPCICLEGNRSNIIHSNVRIPEIRSCMQARSHEVTALQPATNDASSHPGEPIACVDEYDGLGIPDPQYFVGSVKFLSASHESTVQLGVEDDASTAFSEFFSATRDQQEASAFPVIEKIKLTDSAFCGEAVSEDETKSCDQYSFRKYPGTRVDIESLKFSIAPSFAYGCPGHRNDAEYPCKGFQDTSANDISGQVCCARRLEPASYIRPNLLVYNSGCKEGLTKGLQGRTNSKNFYLVDQNKVAEEEFCSHDIYCDKCVLNGPLVKYMGGFKADSYDRSLGDQYSTTVSNFGSNASFDNTQNSDILRKVAGSHSSKASETGKTWSWLQGVIKSWFSPYTSLDENIPSPDSHLYESFSEKARSRVIPELDSQGSHSCYLGSFEKFGASYTHDMACDDTKNAARYKFPYRDAAFHPAVNMSAKTYNINDSDNERVSYFWPGSENACYHGQNLLSSCNTTCVICQDVCKNKLNNSNNVEMPSYGKGAYNPAIASYNTCFPVYAFDNVCTHAAREDLRLPQHNCYFQGCGPSNEKVALQNNACLYFTQSDCLGTHDRDVARKELQDSPEGRKLSSRYKSWVTEVGIMGL